ncbi:hypothetical protein C2845_PM11G16760 [Panicum miliaceum]|uniref:F-box protein AT5G49610-like beta-propeller domain-containing protein n=1 Tax=Panicum miliaceum TaxID=4540 RepID=A0A3L6RQN3_PANMI|nr:hypothetical protein C2845_PM11G16760 [Panicum miliaceum]
MEGDAQLRSAATSAVFGSDDLLREILLRLGFPTFLVDAALVSKTWLRNASDPAFLRSFRRCHRPRLLDFYDDSGMECRPRFIPISRAPELAAAVHRASSIPGRFTIWAARNCHLLVYDGCTPVHMVLSPLHAMRLVAFPTPSSKRLDQASVWFFHAEDGREDGAVVVEVVLTNTKVQAEVRAMASGVWGVVCTTAAMELQLPAAVPLLPCIENILPPFQGIVHIVTNHRCILELDTVAASISAIRLPDSVATRNFKVSRSEDLGLFLVHAKGSLLSVWNHRIIGSNGVGDWALVGGTIHVREACNRGEDVSVLAVDDNGEFVLLGLNTSARLMCVHVKSKIEEVYEEMPMLPVRGNVFPFMMVWPPIFPALREEHSQEK